MKESEIYFESAGKEYDQFANRYDGQVKPLYASMFKAIYYLLRAIYLRQEDL